MTTDRNYRDWVALYLDGELTVDEVQAFEENLKNDKALQEELRLQRLAQELIEEEFTKKKEQNYGIPIKPSSKMLILHLNQT